MMEGLDRCRRCGKLMECNGRHLWNEPCEPPMEEGVRGDKAEDDKQRTPGPVEHQVRKP